MRKKTSGLKWFAILLMVLTQVAQARDKLPVYEMSFVSKGNEKLCSEIKIILENPINKDFGDWLGAWNFKEQIATSAFNLPKGYNRIRWIEWKKIPLTDIRKYIDDSEWIERILAKGLPDQQPSSIEKAVIAFPIVGKKYPQPIAMLRIIDSDGRYNQQRCHIPMASRKYFNKAFWHDVNNMKVNYPWCNFFSYQGKLYHATWTTDEQYEIDGGSYINKQKYLTYWGRTCIFRNDGDQK